MIIEKKQSLPSISQIIVPNNYVLIKMEAKYDSFQMKGKETGIMASDFIYDNNTKVNIDERLVSPFGNVMKKPLNLIFNGRKIKQLSDKYQPIRNTGAIGGDGERLKVIVDYSTLREITALKTSSVNYDTDIEVKEGDRVHVSYLHFLNAEKEGLFIDTQEGRMVMVKYDLLRMVVDVNNQPIKMLNGYILLEPKEYDINTVDDRGNEFTQLESGLVLLNAKKTKRTRKNQLGKVLLSGSPLRGYLDDATKIDRETYYKKGDKILYDPRLALKLENELHQIISEKDLYLIRREAIIIDEYDGFDLDKIEI